MNKKIIQFSRAKTLGLKEELKTHPRSLKLSIYITFTEIGSV